MEFILNSYVQSKLGFWVLTPSYAFLLWESHISSVANLILLESNVANLMLLKIVSFGNLLLINISEHANMVVWSMHVSSHGDLHVSWHGGIVIWLAVLDLILITSLLVLLWDWRNSKQVACLEESHMDDVTQVCLHYVG